MECEVPEIKESSSKFTPELYLRTVYFYQCVYIYVYIKKCILNKVFLKHYLRRNC